MIEFKHVSKSFGTKRVLDDISFCIPDGKITFIVGKSGEGKSVTMKHIMLLLRPDSGSIEVNGNNIIEFNSKRIQEYRKKIGILFQSSALFDSLTVGENVYFVLKEFGSYSFMELKEKAEDILTQVGLPGIQHKYPSQLSTGEKKRVGLARALVSNPDIIIYDEPTTGMDPIVSEMIDELILRVNHQRSLTSIVISHDLKATLTTADKIIMLHSGKIRLEGEPELFKNSQDPIVRQFFSGRSSV